MKDAQLQVMQQLQVQVQQAVNFQELTTATLETGEAFANAFGDKKVDWSDAGFFLVLPGVIQRGLEDSDQIIPELSTISDDDFEIAFVKAAASFEITGKPELTTDLKGIVKGIMHGIRIFARSKAPAEAA